MVSASDDCALVAKPETFCRGAKLSLTKFLKFFIYLNGRPQTSNLCHKNEKESLVNYKGVIQVFFFLL